MKAFASDFRVASGAYRAVATELHSRYSITYNLTSA